MFNKSIIIFSIFSICYCYSQILVFKGKKMKMKYCIYKSLKHDTRRNLTCIYVNNIVFGKIILLYEKTCTKFGFMQKIKAYSHAQARKSKFKSIAVSSSSLACMCSSCPFTCELQPLILAKISKTFEQYLKASDCSTHNCKLVKLQDFPFLLAKSLLKMCTKYQILTKLPYLKAIGCSNKKSKDQIQKNTPFLISFART